jgi:hypothetical protein
LLPLREKIATLNEKLPTAKQWIADGKRQKSRRLFWGDLSAT